MTTDKQQYKNLSTHTLLQLRQSVMHSIQLNDESHETLHREYTSIRIELATRNLDAMETEPLEREPVGETTHEQQ